MSDNNGNPQDRTLRSISTAIFLLAVLLSAWFRVSEIGIKPFHHDEGVNSFFLLNLARSGDYQYNPENYHGPSLYYLTLLSLRALGETDLALRFWPAAFGVLTVLLLWPLRRQLGRVGTPAAAFFVAVSPGLVYYSRDFIHETIFGACSLGIVAGVVRYTESKKFLWLGLAAASFGLMVTTKETVVVNVAVMLAALGCALLWEAARDMLAQGEGSPAALVRRIRAAGIGTRPSLDHTLAALIVILSIYVFLYSSFFKHPQGMIDFLRSILHWTSERSSRDHVHPFTYYLGILFKLELPLLAGALLAGVFVALRGTRFWLFTAAWTLGTFLAYSLIPYKTPWLLVGLLIPMAVVCGHAAEQLWQTAARTGPRLLVALLLATALAFAGRLAWQVNFAKHDDNTNASGYFPETGLKLKLTPYTDSQYGYVYAQTDRDFLFLVEAIRKQAERMPADKHTGIYVASPDYWPLPWYLREYDQVAFVGQLPPAHDGTLAISQPIIVARADQREQLDRIPGIHAATQPFTLRPGVELLLYVREASE
ncbi:MAG: TIGR03663 family protein [Blastocatellia bacterium]|nr:TIGR03663 family protein [Blastocatellia bacterium]